MQLPQLERYLQLYKTNIYAFFTGLDYSIFKNKIERI